MVGFGGWLFVVLELGRFVRSGRVGRLEFFLVLLYLGFVGVVIFYGNDWIEMRSLFFGCNVLGNFKGDIGYGNIL